MVCVLKGIGITPDEIRGEETKATSTNKTIDEEVASSVSEDGILTLL